jgi:Family of unknown function (DUF6519)
MSGEFSRLTFDASRHFDRVYLQQGRVLLDADWNEQVDIVAHQLRQRTRDLLGGETDLLDGSSAFVGAAFELTEGPDGAVRLRAGRAYVDGILVENDDDVRVDDQPDLRSPHWPPDPDVAHLVYLDAWHRDVGALEVPGLLESALGDVDTSIRRRTVWQARTVALGCASPRREAVAERWEEVLAEHAPGRTRLRACATDTGALENLLYRVEIRGTRDQPTLLWSHDNASLAFRVLSVAPAARDASAPRQFLVTVADTRHDLLVLQNGHQVELTDEDCVLGDEEPFYAAVLEPDVLGAAGTQGQRTVRVEVADRRAAERLADRLDGSPLAGPVLRRWDSRHIGGQPLAGPGVEYGEPIELEWGLKVAFDGPLPRPGDHWSVPARPACERGVDWPEDGRERHGTDHHLALLGILWPADGGWRVEDLRAVLPPLLALGTAQAETQREVDRLGEQEVSSAADRRDLRATAEELAEELARVRRELTAELSRARHAMAEGLAASQRELAAVQRELAVAHDEVARVLGGPDVPVRQLDLGEGARRGDVVVVAAASPDAMCGVVLSVHGGGEGARARVVVAGWGHCRAGGPVRRGDLLVPREGRAVRLARWRSWFYRGPVLGRALSSLRGDGSDAAKVSGWVEVMVGTR